MVCGSDYCFERRFDRFDCRLSDIRLAFGCGNTLTIAVVASAIRVYDEAGNVIETHEHSGDFKEW